MNEQLKLFLNTTAANKLGSKELKEVLEFVLLKTLQVHTTLSQL